jgi:hypothetical protein
MMCPVARGYRAGAASTRCIHQRGSRYRKPVQLLQKDASRTEGKHNEDSQGKARRRVLALPNGQTSVAISANSILQARERDVERVIPRTPSIAGAAPSSFSASSTALLLPSRIARFTRSATGIPNIHSRYFCPDIAAGLWRDEAPLALPTFAPRGCRACRGRDPTYTCAVACFRIIPNRPFLLKRLRSGRIGSASQIRE